MADSEREIEGALWLNRLVSPARAGATHDSRKKQGPAKRVPRSAGFAICSPRGIREPRDFAPRGSVHLSRVEHGGRYSAPLVGRHQAHRGSVMRKIKADSG